MKIVLCEICAIGLLAACTKENNKDEKENHCPVIAASQVPSAVIAGFNAKYPSQSVVTWFQKDSVGFCAYFISAVNKKTLAEFTPTGTFVSEEVDIDHDGNFEDSTDTGGGPKENSTCECEIPE
jgi:hypothetical protein